MAQQTEPVIILAGIEYPGVYKNDVFEHIRGCMAERAVLAKEKRDAARKEYEAFWDGVEVMDEWPSR